MALVIVFLSQTVNCVQPQCNFDDGINDLKLKKGKCKIAEVYFYTGREGVRFAIIENKMAVRASEFTHFKSRIYLLKIPWSVRSGWALSHLKTGAVGPECGGYGL